MIPWILETVSKHSLHISLHNYNRTQSRTQVSYSYIIMCQITVKIKVQSLRPGIWVSRSEAEFLLFYIRSSPAVLHKKLPAPPLLLHKSSGGLYIQTVFPSSYFVWLTEMATGHCRLSVSPSPLRMLKKVTRFSLVLDLWYLDRPLTRSAPFKLV